MSDSDESSLIINDEYDNSNDNIIISPTSNIDMGKKITNHLQPNKGDNTHIKEIKDFELKKKQ